MSKRVRLLGKTIPVWLLILALVAAGWGAAVGTVLSGKVVGEMPVTVSQALEVGTPVNPDDVDWESNDFTGPQSVALAWGTEIKADRFIGTVSDDQTAFQAAAEFDAGDKLIILVPLKNASNQDLVAELNINYPDGFTVEVVSADQFVKDQDPDPGDMYIKIGGNDVTETDNAYTKNMVRTSLTSWKFEVTKDADKTTPAKGTAHNDSGQDSIAIVIAASDTIAPGFYTIEGKIKQISY